MLGELAILVSGTARDSLGEAFVHLVRRRYSDSPIVAVDKECNPGLQALQGVHQLAIDLNPFTCDDGYAGLASRLASGLEDAQHVLGFEGIGTVVLGAGTYESGTVLETQLEGRQRLIGVNVCGRIEVIYASLAMNQRIAFGSTLAFALIDVGTLHGLTRTPNRPLYVATKALGLDLCFSMRRGGEVDRAIYLAPGPIDTHMLHRNHWVSKEYGPSAFFEHVRSLGAEMYRDVFVRCNDTAFAEAVSCYPSESEELAELFVRYKLRRERQFADEQGVLLPTDLADRLVAIVANGALYTDGVYILTAPSGKVKMRQLSFSDVARYEIHT